MSSAAVFGLFAGLGIAAFLLGLAYFVLTVVGLWKLFEKAGEPGWKSIVPIYNSYVSMKFSWKPLWFWITLIVSVIYGVISVEWLSVIVGIVLIVLTFLADYKLAKSFGKGIGYALGIYFLRPIFTIILGFGSAEYVGNSTPEDKLF